ncbi:gluconate 2-dehydrogenase subunit 3 family protein [Pseudooceanicola aestuarii]|uniref:gluconate 2-dehydrogenase subunit 3 family protein n=1 Tax=Pseudooceanicola aestuarii TaxID=2697319 RepID=UPI0013D6A430|nr:gluconate 2-dehydrogenase subunit 3 family protein [Pseudooceanicola aestuarii]
MSRDYLSTTRRGFLGATAALPALVATGAPGRAAVADDVPLEQYEPEFLTPAEWAFVMAATARIIPSEGDGPGALEARVPVFIDRQLAGDFGAAADLYMEGPFVPDAPEELGPQSPLTPAEIYRGAIAALDARLKAGGRPSFVERDAKAQDAFLTDLSEGRVRLEPELREFWDLLLQNTREGYFADPMYGGNAGMAAWKHIGFPGARGSYTEWVGRAEDYPLGPVSISGERG